PVMYKGTPVIPMEFLKALLPEPSSLAENYTGKTSIGVVLKGEKKGKKKRYMIWNVTDHAETNKELGAQAVSYTTGVPPVVGAMIMYRGEWTGKAVFNVEQHTPLALHEELGKQRLPWHVEEIDKQDQKKLFSVET